MNKKILCLVVGLAVMTLASSPLDAKLRLPQILGKKVVDLSHALEEGMPQYSEQVHFSLNNLTNYSQGYYANALAMPEHIGTHVDAPSHFFPGKKTVDQLDSAELIGNAFVLNMTSQAQKNANYRLTLDDLKAWELENGPIRRDSIVILRTGWESRWFKPKAFANKDSMGGYHFPGYSCEVVAYLSRNRNVRALGTDTFSIDAGNTEDFCAHRILMGANKYAIEGLTNLESLPARGAVITVAPLKVKSGSGAPARVLAWLPY